MKAHSHHTRHDRECRRRTLFAVACICAVLCLICASQAAFSATPTDPNTPENNIHGELQFRYDNFLVGKDRGRFREDQWMTDGSTPGLEQLHIKSKSTSPEEYDWTIQGRALHDYDYRLSARMEKKDRHYLALDFSSFRRYFDGSNELWRAPLSELAERPDWDIFSDRRNYNVEFGTIGKEGPNFILGWHRLVKDGKDVLLHGADAVSIDSADVSSVPIVANIRGITDTFYAEAYQTFADKYNFRVRQEFEQYRENGKTDISSYNIGGSVANSDVLVDHLGYTNWRTLFMFDSFLDDQTYVTANYMYNYLNNDSTRDDIGYHEVTTANGGNSRKTNAASFGYRRDRIMSVEHLSLILGLRVEDSRTTAHMSGTSNYYDFTIPGYTGPKPRIVQSKMHDIPVSEILRLTYRGLERTTLSFDADLEQRAVHWWERDRHGGVLSDPDQSRKTDIDILNQLYTVKAVHRFNRHIKSTAKFSFNDRQRTYTDIIDETQYFPGYMGDYRITGNNASFSTDFSLANNTALTLLYDFVQEGINTSLGGKTQNLEIHRGAGSFSCHPANNLFLVTTFMLENYDLDTPAVGTAPNHAPGSRPYDFRGSSYSLLLDGMYAFNEKTSCTFGFRHTEALGTVDTAGNYAYDTAELMLKHVCAQNQTLGIGYQFMNFNSHTGNFDDYTAHGLTATYAFTF